MIALAGIRPVALADKDICAKQTPPFREISTGCFVACHFAEKLSLKGSQEQAA